YDRMGQRRVSLDKNLPYIQWLLKRILDHAPADCLGTPPKTRFSGPWIVLLAAPAVIASLVAADALGVMRDPGGFVPPLFFCLAMLGVGAAYFRHIRVGPQALEIWSVTGHASIPYSDIKHARLAMLQSRSNDIGLMLAWGD